MSALLEIENLTKSFGGVHAVRSCSFSVPEGQVTGLIGPNGAGKSTVVDLVSGFGQPDSGSVTFAGQPLVGKRPDVISRLGLIRTFQTPREWRNLTVMDNVLLARRRFASESLWRSLTRARRIRREEEADRAAVRDILERFQLAELRNELAVRLSGGQKRLLEFARIAAAEARLIILDEPMGGVNPVLGARIGEAVRQFAAEGRAVVVVEHNLPFIENTSHQVVVMDLGEVIAQGPFSGLRENPRVVDAYLGMDQSHEWPAEAGPEVEPEIVLSTEGLTAGYGGPPIIEDISLTVRAGKIAAIVGPNGAGKSTLLKALTGLLRVSRGDTYIRGEKTTNIAPEKLVKRGLGYVPQVSNVFPDLTVRENMEMGAYTRPRGVDARIDEICELFPDLGRSLRRRAAMLSGGQRSMLAMARALMLKPVVMLLDEPSAGLSPLLQGALWEQIEKIASTGVGICAVEQNTRRTLRHAHWGYILVLGRNRLDGPAQELLHDNSVVDLYVGRMS